MEKIASNPVTPVAQRCNAQRSDAQRKFFTTLSISLFLQRHRCDALPCFLASPVEIFYIAHIAFRPLLPIFLSPQWFTVQNNKKLTKSHNAAMSPLATRDGQRKRKRKRSDAVHLPEGIRNHVNVPILATFAEFQQGMATQQKSLDVVSRNKLSEAIGFLKDTIGGS